MADPFIGEIRALAFNFNPRGWLLCNGALLDIAQNSTLFSLLGTTYGGDGRISFGLPDLRGRAAMSKGRHPGSAFNWQQGEKVGSETHTMTLPQMPSHNHGATFSATEVSTVNAGIMATTENGDSATPSVGAYLAAATPPSSSGPDKPEKIYNTAPKADTEVKLNGLVVSSGGSGTVTIDNSGESKPFSIIQPVLTINYCMAQVGVYPPRS